MKNLSFKNLGLDANSVLQRSELKDVLGGRNLTIDGGFGGGGASCKGDACSESNLCGSQCICDLGDNTCFLH